MSVNSALIHASFDRNRRWDSTYERLPEADGTLTSTASVGFSAVRASRDAQLGQLGRIKLDNTLTNFHSGWESRHSIFECKQQAGTV